MRSISPSQQSFGGGAYHHPNNPLVAALLDFPLLQERGRPGGRKPNPEPNPPVLLLSGDLAGAGEEGEPEGFDCRRVYYLIATSNSGMVIKGGSAASIRRWPGLLLLRIGDKPGSGDGDVI